MTLPDATPAPDATDDVDTAPVEDASTDAADAPAGDADENVDGADAADEDEEFEAPGDDTIPEQLRPYINRLRDREAKYRIQARETSEQLGRFEVLDRLHENDVKSFMLAFEDLASGDPAAEANAAEFFAHVAKQLGAGGDAGDPEPAADEDDEDFDLDALDDDSVLTKAEVLRLMQAEKDRETAAAQAAAQKKADEEAEAALMQTLADAGVPENDQLKVLVYANEANGDMPKAIERYQAEIKTIKDTAIEEFLAKKAADADATASTAPNGVAPTSPKGAAKTDKELQALALAKYQALTTVTE